METIHHLLFVIFIVQIAKVKGHKVIYKTLEEYYMLMHMVVMINYIRVRMMVKIKTK